MAGDRLRLERGASPHSQQAVAELQLLPFPGKPKAGPVPRSPWHRTGQGEQEVAHSGDLRAQRFGLAKSSVSKSHSNGVGPSGAPQFFMGPPLPMASLLSPSLSSIVSLPAGGSRVCGPAVTAGSWSLSAPGAPQFPPPLLSSTPPHRALLALHSSTRPCCPPPNMPSPHSLPENAHSFIHSSNVRVPSTLPNRWALPKVGDSRVAMMTGSLL